MKSEIVKTYESTAWGRKANGVVLVDTAYDIEPVWQFLCEQDDYWESYKNLIKVKPADIKSIDDIKRLCEYTGKTDIEDVPAFIAKMKELDIDIFIYTYSEQMYSA